MAHFEVILPPAPPEQPFEVKLRVESDTWLGALKLGLERICGPALAEQVVCDVRGDDAMEVQDPRGGRTFRIVALGAAPRAVPGTSASARPAARPEAAPAAAKPAAKPAPPAPAPLAAAAPRPRRTPAERAREDLLADLFLRAPRALAKLEKEADALGAMLDLAREKVACGGATAWTADAARGVLSPAASRGAAPQARALPFGSGIAGFCAQEGVCLAVSDAARDPRFLAGGPGPAPRTVLCAPVAAGNRVFGVLELADRAEGPFGDADLAALAYLAHQAARWLDAREKRRA